MLLGVRVLLRVEECVWSAVRVGVCVLGALWLDVDDGVTECVIQLAVMLGVELRDTSVLDAVGVVVCVRVALRVVDGDGVDERDARVALAVGVVLGEGVQEGVRELDGVLEDDQLRLGELERDGGGPPCSHPPPPEPPAPPALALKVDMFRKP